MAQRIVASELQKRRSVKDKQLKDSTSQYALVQQAELDDPLRSLRELLKEPVRKLEDPIFAGLMLRDAFKSGNQGVGTTYEQTQELIRQLNSLYQQHIRNKLPDYLQQGPMDIWTGSK